MTGYKTYAVAIATSISGLVLRWGFEVDPILLVDTAFIVIPAIMAFMRTITHTSPGKKR